MAASTFHQARNQGALFETSLPPCLLQAVVSQVIEEKPPV